MGSRLSDLTIIARKILQLPLQFHHQLSSAEHPSLHFPHSCIDDISEQVASQLYPVSGELEAPCYCSLRPTIFINLLEPYAAFRPAVDADTTWHATFDQSTSTAVSGKTLSSPLTQRIQHQARYLLIPATTMPTVVSMYSNSKGGLRAH